MLHKDTITEKMEKISQIIFNDFESDYYLAGGTAIALQIGHRKSIDLDYFINKNIDTFLLKNQILEKFDGYSVQFVFEEKNTLWCVIDGVKVSFISRFDVLIKEAIVLDGFRLATLDDLVAMKLLAICGREEYKDYFDLACLSAITDIREWNNWWQKVYKNSDPISFMIALANADKILEIPLYINDNFKNISVKENISKALLEIKKFVL